MNPNREKTNHDDALLRLILADEAKSAKAAPGAAFMEELNQRIDQTSKRPLFKPWYAAAAGVLLALFAGYYALQWREKSGTELVSVAALVGNVRNGGRNVNIGDRLKPGSVLETAADGYLIINFGSVASMFLGPDSKVIIVSAHSGDTPDLRLRQDFGTSFSSIVPGKANYRLSTGGIEFRVLGTAFSIDSYANDEARLKVLHGTVAVQNNKQTLKIKPGEEISCARAECKASEKIDAQSEARLIQLSATHNQQDLQALADSDRNRHWTLPALKEKYGKLSVIETTAGKKYQGGFRAFNGRLYIQTMTEKVEIDSSLVKKIIPAKDAK
jgi:hypothetical protein